jgi:hypothetical protein
MHPQDKKGVLEGQFDELGNRGRLAVDLLLENCSLALGGAATQVPRILRPLVRCPRGLASSYTWPG